jgi:hypothetical protein
MIPQTPMPLPKLPTLAAWQVGWSRMGGYVRIVVATIKRNRHPAQGCLPMTE